MVTKGLGAVIVGVIVSAVIVECIINAVIIIRLGILPLLQWCIKGISMPWVHPSHIEI